MRWSQWTVVGRVDLPTPEVMNWSITIWPVTSWRATLSGLKRMYPSMGRRGSPAKCPARIFSERVSGLRTTPLYAATFLAIFPYTADTMPGVVSISTGKKPAPLNLLVLEWTGSGPRNHSTPL